MKKINDIFYARRLYTDTKLSIIKKHQYIRFKYIQFIIGIYEKIHFRPKGNVYGTIDINDQMLTDCWVCFYGWLSNQS